MVQKNRGVYERIQVDKDNAIHAQALNSAMPRHGNQILPSAIDILHIADDPLNYTSGKLALVIRDEKEDPVLFMTLNDHELIAKVTSNPLSFKAYV